MAPFSSSTLQPSSDPISTSLRSRYLERVVILVPVLFLDDYLVAHPGRPRELRHGAGVAPRDAGSRRQREPGRPSRGDIGVFGPSQPRYEGPDLLMEPWHVQIDLRGLPDRIQDLVVENRASEDGEASGGVDDALHPKLFEHRAKDRHPDINGLYLLTTRTARPAQARVELRCR